MKLIETINEWAKHLLSLLGIVFGIGIFSELLFGKFLGSFSIISNFINIVGQFGNAGFVGLIAMLVILIFISKDK